MPSKNLAVDGLNVEVPGSLLKLRPHNRLPPAQRKGLENKSHSGIDDTPARGTNPKSALACVHCGQSTTDIICCWAGHAFCKDCIDPINTLVRLLNTNPKFACPVVRCTALFSRSAMRQFYHMAPIHGNKFALSAGRRNFPYATHEEGASSSGSESIAITSLSHESLGSNTEGLWVGWEMLTPLPGSSKS